jgi:hypothetical protein
MEVILSNGYTTLVDEEVWLGKSLFLLPWYAASLPLAGEFARLNGA